MITNSNIKELITDFIIKLCCRERFIEVRRQILSDKSDFDPYKAFSFIQSLEKHHQQEGISPNHVINFLKSIQVEVQLSQIEPFFRHLTRGQNMILTYKEFLDLVLPREHPELRAFVTQKECVKAENGELLSLETQHALAGLIKEELGIFKVVGKIKKKLMASGLNCDKIIEIVDFKNRDCLNFNNLKNFIQESGVIPYDTELISFLRRVDRDDDGVVNIQEFKNFMNLSDGMTSATKNNSNQEINLHPKLVSRSNKNKYNKQILANETRAEFNKTTENVLKGANNSNTRLETEASILRESRQLRDSRNGLRVSNYGSTSHNSQQQPYYQKNREVLKGISGPANENNYQKPLNNDIYKTAQSSIYYDSRHTNNNNNNISDLNSSIADINHSKISVDSNSLTQNTQLKANRSYDYNKPLKLNPDLENMSTKDLRDQSFTPGVSFIKPPKLYLNKNATISPHHISQDKENNSEDSSINTRVYKSNFSMQRKKF